MTNEESLSFPAKVKSKLVGQMLLDPGIPKENPTVPTWQLPTHPLANVQSKQLSRVTDFAIIGAGITGCAVAKTLLESPHLGNRSVTVLEARTMAGGATSRNAGFLKSHVLSSFQHFVEEYGKDEAIVFSHYCNRTLQKMDDLITAQGPSGEKASERRNVQCILAYKDKTLMERAITSTELHQKSVHEQNKRILILDQETLEKVHHLRGFVGGISVPATVFWPYRVVTGIFESLLNAYGEQFAIETNTPVTSITYSPETDCQHPYIVKTSRGEVRAGHIFHCSNAFAGHLLPRLRGKIFPTRHTNSCQSPGPQFPNVGSQQCWLFPSKAGYNPMSGIYTGGLYYLQQNAKTGALFFGGQKHQMEDFISADDREVSSTSRADLSTMLPKLFNKGWNDPATGAIHSPEVQTIWSGIIGSTPDHNPLVGKVPISISERGGAHGGEWIAAGYNGYGMSQCWSSGEAVALMSLGKPVPQWLPKALLISEERLFNEERMGIEKALKSLVGSKWGSPGPTAVSTC